MYFKTRTLLFLSCFLLSNPFQLYAEDYDESEHEYKQKLILLQGKKSRLMDGHSRPAFNFNKKEALPYYLARGWTIQHIYFDQTNTPNKMYAYAVIEKWQKIKKRFSHRR